MALRFCHNGTKKRYESREDAEAALDTIRSLPPEEQTSKIPTLAYKCPHCKGFHLSSRKIGVA